jgi:hypothetical protein
MDNMFGAGSGYAYALASYRNAQSAALLKEILREITWFPREIDAGELKDHLQNAIWNPCCLLAF